MSDNIKFSVSSSPHITSGNSTRRIMLDVVIALIPAMIAAVLLYGFYSLFLIALSVGSCVLAEFLFSKIKKEETTVGDCSAVVSGVILALNLPPAVPFYVPIFGGFFAMMIVKMLFGGLGRNFANPAITARIFLMLAWTGIMTKFVKPIDLSKGFAEMFSYFKFAFTTNGMDVVTGATPLSYIKAGAFEHIDLTDMFLGRIGGSMGEVSALALLIGGAYLVVRKVIDWKIPAIYIGSVALFTLAFKGNIDYVLPSLLGGGLIFGAFFMATDYATSPNTPIGVVVYALGLGLLTTLFRIYGSMDEGVSFAILIMNILVPLIDKFIIRRPFGYVPKKRERKPKKIKEETK